MKIDETGSGRSQIVTIGRSAPLGAQVISGGANFSVFSRNASRIELLLFDRADDDQPSRVIEFDATINRTLDYWHIFVEGVRSGQIYGYRALPRRCAQLFPRR